MPEHKFRPIEPILNSILKKHGLDRAINENRILQNWTNIVGVHISKQCQPVQIENDTLVLEIKNKVWRRELARRQKELVNLLDKKINHNPIKKIKLI